MDSEVSELVTHGLFRIVRHPIYSGLGLIFFGVLAVTPSALSVALVLVTVGLLAVQLRLEERHLLRAHENRFRSWASRVGRFVPGVGRLPGP